MKAYSLYQNFQTRNRQSFLGIFAALMLASCAQQVGNTPGSPSPASQIAHIHGIEDIIPASERQRVLRRQSVSNVARLEIYPKTYLTNSSGPAYYYIKGFAEDGTDLGILSPQEVVVTAGEGKSLATHVIQNQAFQITPPVGHGLTTFEITLSSNSAVKTYGSVEVVGVKPNVMVIPDQNIDFPRANLDVESLSAADLAQSFSPFTRDEVRTALSGLTPGLPRYPVVVRNTTVAPGQLVAMLELGSLFGRVDRIISQRDGSTLFLLQLELPGEIFDQYEQESIRPTSKWYPLLPDTRATYDSSTLSAKSAGGGLPLDCGQTSIPPWLTLSAEIENPHITSWGPLSGGPFTVEGDLKAGISWDAALGATGECALEWPTGFLPLPGVLSFMSLEVKAGLRLPWEVTLQDLAGGEAKANIHLHLSSDGKEVASQSVRRRAKLTGGGIFNPGNSSSSIYDVRGPEASVLASVAAVPNVTLSLRIGNRYFTKIIDILSLWLSEPSPKPFDAGYLEFVLGLEAKLKGQAASMRTVYDDPSKNPEVSLTNSFFVRAAFGGWLADKLREMGIEPGTFEVAPEINKFSTKVPDLLWAKVIHDNDGEAEVGFGWESAGLVDHVQLGSLSPSVHGDITPTPGGDVHYDMSECGAGKIIGKVLAVGSVTLPELSLTTPPLPFNAQQDVAFCKPPPNIEYVWGHMNYGSSNTPNVGMWNLFHQSEMLGYGEFPMSEYSISRAQLGAQSAVGNVISHFENYWRTHPDCVKTREVVGWYWGGWSGQDVVLQVHQVPRFC